MFLQLSPGSTQQLQAVLTWSGLRNQRLWSGDWRVYEDCPLAIQEDDTVINEDNDVLKDVLEDSPHEERTGVESNGRGLAIHVLSEHSGAADKVYIVLGPVWKTQKVPRVSHRLPRLHRKSQLEDLWEEADLLKPPVPDKIHTVPRE